MRAKALVFSGYGLNCEEETKFAFELAGGKADIVHINDLIDKSYRLSDYQILAFPGGFSYGDDTGSGYAYANKLRNHLWEDLLKFVSEDKLVIGICNGFQILVSLGLLPGLNKTYGKKEVALLPNNSARYKVRWVDVQVENANPWARSTNPWLTGLENFSLPIAHGEGKFYTDEKMLKELNQKGMIALRYNSGKVCAYQQLTPNPNGSLEDIAGITDETGRILGVMPHPERALFMTQLPYWQVVKERLLREGKKFPVYGSGLQVFENAVHYFV